MNNCDLSCRALSAVASAKADCREPALSLPKGISVVLRVLRLAAIALAEAAAFVVKYNV